MTPADLRTLLLRDLDALTRQVEAYPDDQSPWADVPGVANSAGTLALHCAGNLQHYVGARLGGTGYVRDREAEFGRRGVPRAELAAELRRATAIVAEVLADLPAEQFTQPFPEVIRERTLPTGRFLLHLATHLAYHLGQVDYHRRAVTGHGTLAGMVAIPFED